MHNLEDNLTKITDRISQAATEACRNPKSICLLAVSKTQSAGLIREAFHLGQCCFGENYLQEALDKQQQLQDLNIEWHFIGPIQSNKTRLIAENFDWVHTVDRVKIAERLNNQRPQGSTPLNICLQVNIDQEPNKAGVAPSELAKLTEEITELPNLRLRGLMIIPRIRSEIKEQQQVFESVRKELDSLNNTINSAQLDTLSMGMSGDLEAAVHAGATIVRVGTALFGPRQYTQ